MPVNTLYRSTYMARRDRILKWQLALKEDMIKFVKDQRQFRATLPGTSAEIDAIIQSAKIGTI